MVGQLSRFLFEIFGFKGIKCHFLIAGNLRKLKLFTRESNYDTEVHLDSSMS